LASYCSSRFEDLQAALPRGGVALTHQIHDAAVFPGTGVIRKCGLFSGRLI